MWCHSGSVHHLYTVHYVRCDEQEAVSPLDWLYMLVQSCFWGHLLVVRKDCRFKARCYSHLLYTVCGRGSFLTFFVFLLCKDLRFVLSCVKTMTLLWNHIQPLALHTHIVYISVLGVGMHGQEQLSAEYISVLTSNIWSMLCCELETCILSIYFSVSSRLYLWICLIL